MTMLDLPQEIIIQIQTFLCPDTLFTVNKELNTLCKSNYVWGPIVHALCGLKHSVNFWEEFKWFKMVQRHRLNYQRRWTLGCVGKFEPLGQKPQWKPAHTTWVPSSSTCTT